MKRLLLRSTKNQTFSTQVDVLFQNVKALSLPTSLEGLTVSEADGELARRIEADTGFLNEEETRFFRVDTAGGVGYLVAGVMVDREDDGEYFEPSALWPEMR